MPDLRAPAKAIKTPAGVAVISLLLLDFCAFFFFFLIFVLLPPYCWRCSGGFLAIINFRLKRFLLPHVPRRDFRGKTFAGIAQFRFLLLLLLLASANRLTPDAPQYRVVFGSGRDTAFQQLFLAV